MIFDLVQDFAAVLDVIPMEHPRRRILSLLDEATRRDVHFIDRHPTTLFQCLWNSCWWYDCPEASRHYDLSKRTSKEPLPGERPGKQLARLLQGWRQIKEQKMPGFVWLRSLRPPLAHLGAAQKAVLRGHVLAVSSTHYSPDAMRIVSGSHDGTVRVWEVDTGVQLLELKGHEHWIHCVAYSPDGRSIASGANDGTIRVWGADSGMQLFYLEQDELQVICVAYSPDGRHIVHGSGSSLFIRDAENGLPSVCLKGHVGWVSSVNYSPDGRRIVSGSMDKTVRIWDATKGVELLCLEAREDWQPSFGMGMELMASASFSPDGRRVAAGFGDAVCVWDANSGAGVQQSVLVAAAILSISLNPMLYRLVDPLEAWVSRRPGRASARATRAGWRTAK